MDTNSFISFSGKKNIKYSKKKLIILSKEKTKEGKISMFLSGVEANNNITVLYLSKSKYKKKTDPKVKKTTWK